MDWKTRYLEPPARGASKEGQLMVLNEQPGPRHRAPNEEPRPQHRNPNEEQKRNTWTYMKNNDHSKVRQQASKGGQQGGA